MTVKRLYFLLIGLIVLLFAALIAGTYGANSLLAAQANKLNSSKAKSLALAQEQLSLNNAKEDIKKYSGLEQIAQTIVPEDKDQAEAILEIVNIASQNNVNLASITFPASTLGTSTAATSSATSGVAAKIPAPTSSVNSPLNSLSQLLPVTNIPGVYVLQITVQGDPNKPVAYKSFISFLSALEHNRRTAQISTITIEPNGTNPNLLTFTLTLNEYLKP